jgi:hypothetical protein
MKMLLSSKTIAISLREPVHLLPGFERKTPSHLFCDALKFSARLLRALLPQFRVLGEDLLSQRFKCGCRIGLSVPPVLLF